MRVDGARYERGQLILSSLDTEAMRIPYDFKPGEYTLTKTKKKRSNDANSYAWQLMTKIGNILARSKDDVYIDMLKQYGQTGVIKIQNADVDRFTRQMKYVEPHEHLMPEATSRYYRFWLGSSHYSVAEMSSFIDGVVSVAKDMDIETLTHDELSRMKALWVPE